MSRKGSKGPPPGPGLARRAWMLPAALLSAVWQTWWRRRERRPVMAGLVLVPLALAAMVLFMPAQMTGSRAQAASASPAASPSVAASPAAGPARGVSETKDFLKVNPFRIRVNRVPDAPPPTTPPPPPQLPPPVTPVPDMSSKLKLLGTFLMGDQRWAVMNVVVKGREEVFREGDTPLPNSRITRIEPRRVQVIVDSHDVTLEIDYLDWKGGQQTQAAAAPAPGPGYMPPPPDPLSPLPAAPPEGQPRRLARAEVDGYLDNLNTLLTQVNIQPVFQAGQPAGFRLTDIQKGTILDQIGVSDGDTLRFVNGQRIDSVQSAFQLYNILKESTNVEITVIRNTRPVTLRYLIY